LASPIWAGRFDVSPGDLEPKFIRSSAVIVGKGSSARGREGGENGNGGGGEGAVCVCEREMRARAIVSLCVVIRGYVHTHIYTHTRIHA
jgi:hypothetical protein